MKDYYKTNRKRIERLQSFAKSTRHFNWQASADAATSGLFEEVQNMVLAEIAYYHKARLSRKRWSLVARTTAWVFATIGILVPLIAATGINDWSLWGYPMLALAAAVLGANALFGGSSGHARFVLTELQLERELSLMTLVWQNLVAEDAPQSGRIEHLRSVMANVYEIMLAESQAWVSEQAEELRKFKAQAK